MIVTEFNIRFRRNVAGIVGCFGAVISLYSYLLGDGRVPYWVYLLANVLMTMSAVYLFSIRKVDRLSNFKGSLKEEELSKLNEINRRVWAPFFLMLFSVALMFVAKICRAYISEFYMLAISALTLMALIAIGCQVSLKRAESKLYERVLGKLPS